MRPEPSRNGVGRATGQEIDGTVLFEIAEDRAVTGSFAPCSVVDAEDMRVTTSEIADLQRFAAGLLLDKAAGQAGLTLEWSNGQTEGQVNRLKTVKRQMYGRAGFDLLRQRVLHGT